MNSTTTQGQYTDDWFISPTRTLLSSKLHTPAAAAAKSLQLCLTLRPHRRQATRLPRPWDSPGKNTGVGCHFLLQCMKVKSESELAQSCQTLHDPKNCSLQGSSIHGIFQARVLEWGAIAFMILERALLIQSGHPSAPIYIEDKKSDILPSTPLNSPRI